MNRLCRTGLVLSIGVFIVGCTTVKETYAPTEDALKKRAANELGYPASDLKISNVRAEGGKTYFLIDTPKGRHTCAAYSGGMAAFASAANFGATMDTARLCEKQ